MNKANLVDLVFVSYEEPEAAEMVSLYCRDFIWCSLIAVQLKGDVLCLC